MTYCDPSVLAPYCGNSDCRKCQPTEEQKEKHCEKCSHETEEGLAISGCNYCGCHHPQEQTVGWEEEFDKEFVVTLDEDDGSGKPTGGTIKQMRPYVVKDIKSFIRSLLTRLEAQKEEEVLAKIDSLKESDFCKSHDGPCEGCAFKDGVNSALQAILDWSKKYRKE